MNIYKKLLVLSISLVFFLSAFITIKDYGINFDEPFHFSRGQAYLNFYLTGNKDYSNFPKYPRLDEQKCLINPGGCITSPPFPDDVTPFLGIDYLYKDAVNDKYKQENKEVWRSFFQNDGITFNEVIKMEDGHPPVGGILSSLSNYIFYQRMHVLGDVESYHLSYLIISSLLIFLFGLFVYEKLGFRIAFFSSLILAFYPLFFAESHFNVKDPIETSFFSIAIIFFYWGIVKRKIYHLVISSIVSGLALGTKFNAVFLPFVVAPWFIFYIFQNRKARKLIQEKYILFLGVFPIISLITFYLFWPYLWPDPINNIQSIIKYYKTIGTGSSSEQARFVIFGFNLFPTFWIAVTTPLVVLFSFVLGVFQLAKNILKKRDDFYLLIFLWVMIPIIRVSLPNTVIYGGIRHIMEFLPAFCLIAALGIDFVLEKIKLTPVRIFSYAFFVLLIIYPTYKWHPNQNLYFNELIGGLKGAQRENIPFWGNTYGNAYFQAVYWLNQNAEPGARVGLPISTMANIPRLFLRSDISFNNGYWSGSARLGEYEMEVTYDYPQKQWYSFQYYDVFLKPVYELIVDDVVVLKIWKNSPEYLQDNLGNEERFTFVEKMKTPSEIILELPKEIRLTRVEIKHDVKNCKPQKGGYIALSADGQNWQREPEAIDYPQVPPAAVGYSDENFVFLIPARSAKYISLNTGDANSCLLKGRQIKVFGIN